jgi:hypothetical protein
MVFTKSREITLQILDKSTSETPGAKLNMLSNLPVRFNDYVKSFLSYMRHKLKLQNFTKSRAIILKILKYPDKNTQVHNYTCRSTFL